MSAVLTEPGCRPAAVRPLVAVLHQLADLVRTLTPAQYAQKPVGVVPGSVGGHVRHCLDHVEALLAGAGRGAVDYDRRERGTAVETCRQAALDALGRLERRLLDFPAYPERRPLRLTALLTSAGPAAEADTTLGRELAFVLSHTIHHGALIAVMARLLGVAVPDRLGYAPATLAHQERQACAR